MKITRRPAFSVGRFPFGNMAGAAGVSLLLGAGLAVSAMLLEDKFIYFPAKYPEGYWEIDKIHAVEGAVVPAIEDCHFVTADGLDLHGWYCEPRWNKGGALVPVPAPMIFLWFHGNAGNITHRYDMIRMVMELPVRVFIIDYRGYGKSEGTPSEQGLYRDAHAAWDYLIMERRIPADEIIILGKSLGAAVAIDLAAKVKPAGLIVQSGFTSIRDMARTIMPLIPSVLFRTEMNSMEKVRYVRCPKLFVHSPADEIVPYEFGRRLFDASSEPKQFYQVPGASHNETYLVGGKAYFEALRGFVQFCARSDHRTVTGHELGE